MIIAVTRCHCVCNSLNLSCGCYCGGSFCFNLDGPIATGGDDVGACIYPRMIGLNSDGLKKRFGNVFFAMPFAVILLVDANLLRNWRKTTNSQPHGQTAVPT